MLLHPSGRLVFITPEKLLLSGGRRSAATALVRDHGSADFLGARLAALPAPLALGAYPFLAMTLLGLAGRTPQDATGAERCAVSVRPVDSNVRGSAR